MSGDLGILGEGVGDVGDDLHARDEAPAPASAWVLSTMPMAGTGVPGAIVARVSTSFGGADTVLRWRVALTKSPVS